MGAGISNAVQLTQLTETISYIDQNQRKISFQLAELTESVLEMQDSHHNSFLAIKNKVDLAKLHSEYNSCQIGLNRLDNVIQSILTKTLTSFILPPDQVKRYLGSNPILKNSLFYLNPRLVYQLGSIELVNIDPDKQIFTVLLLLPHIQGDSDGLLFTPLHAPRFHLNGDRIDLESSPPIPSLFRLSGDHGAPGPLLSMDTGLCRFINKGAICPLAGQYFDDSTYCSNVLLGNDSMVDVEQACHFVTYSLPGKSHTSLKESSTALLLFSNEETVGITDSGRISIIPQNSPPSCVLINKLHLASLIIGNKTFRLNIRTDVFEIPSGQVDVIRHLHMVKETLPFALKRGVPNLHPSSIHFIYSFVTVFAICLASVLLFGLINHFLPRQKKGAHFDNPSPDFVLSDPGIADPHRAEQFVSKH